MSYALTALDLAGDNPGPYMVRWSWNPGQRHCRSFHDRREALRFYALMCLSASPYRGFCEYGLRLSWGHFVRVFQSHWESAL